MAQPNSGTDKLPNGGGDNNGGNAGPVNPATIAPVVVDDGTDDDNYERDSAGNIVYGRDGVTPKRKRGRKAGAGSNRGSSGGNSARKAAPRAHDLKASIDGLSNMLGVLHSGIALAANVPELQLSEEESRELAGAIVPVMEQFDFIPDPRYAAVFGLLIVAGKIYVPRGYLIRERMKENADTKRGDAARPIN